MNDNRPVSEAYTLVAELAGLLDVKDLAIGEGKVWTLQLDKQWIFAVNGKTTTERVEPKDTMGADLSKGDMAVWYNGWLASLMNPFGGTFVVGEGANEDSFIAALKARIAKEGA